ncbi:MAG: LCP family protein [Gaiellales bacterium]
MTVYTGKRPRRRRWRRRVLTAVGTVFILLLAMVGVVAWWANDLYGQITNLDKGVKKAQSELNHTIPLPSQPATALVIGSDHRASDGTGAPSRSDTLMLVRIDPTTKFISLLSLPRDLWVDIPGHGFDKINAAYTDGGPKLAVQTVAAVTGVRPDYLITVDFNGFVDLVNAFGGVYVNVDQHYYHVNTPGTEQYSQIDIPPGYQLLNGLNALAFSRYRHTDSDFYRNARQQLFLQAFEARASAKFHSINITDLGTIKSVAETIARNVEVTGPHGPPSITKMIDYASLAYAIKGRVLSVRLAASTSSVGSISTVTATPEAIKQAVYEWQHPQQVAKPTGQLPTATSKPKKAGFKPRVLPSTVSVTVVNGNGITGSAGKLGDGLSPFGYHVTVSPIPAPNFSYAQTWVYYRPGKARAAADLVKIIGGAQSLPLPSTFSGDPSDVVVVAGHSFHGTTAVKPPKQTVPTGLPPDLVPDDQAYLSYFGQAARTLHFPVLYPTVQQTASSFTPFDYTMPIRTYNIAAAGKGWNSMYAVFAMPNMAGAYWGIEETRFVGAPILDHPDAMRRLDGRVYRFYFNGSHIHLIAIVRSGIAYWLTNTLRDDLSNADMIAIARSLKPVH